MIPNILKFFLAFAVFSIVACADYVEDDGSSGNRCIENPNLPVCQDHQDNQDDRSEPDMSND